MKIQVVIVSDQILANLIPALMERPDKVYLVCSEQMTERGLERRLKKLLAQDAISTEIRGKAPDVGLKAIHDYALQVAADIEEEHPDAAIVLNATGGTKLMALGFVEVFRGLAQRIIYTDTAHRRIEVLPDKDGKVDEAIEMDQVLDVPRYLAAQGFRCDRIVSKDDDWKERAASRKTVAKYLGRHAAEIQDFIGAINGLANAALERQPGSDEERLGKARQALNNVPWGAWAKALGDLARARLVDWREGEAEVEFTDAASALFLRGGWLEEYAWHIVKDERVHDVCMGVHGIWENTSESQNEFDVLACHSNQLLFIECKTLKYQDGNDNEIAYKVDSLSQDARGLFGQTWLLSAREPSALLNERARQARIRLIGPAELPRLREAVQQWMKGQV